MPLIQSPNPETAPHENHSTPDEPLARTVHRYAEFHPATNEYVSHTH